MNPTDIELIYELSPMQQAMLFHSLYAPGSGVYVLQMSLRLTGRLDVPAFERAWRQTVERHAILRTSFFWEDLEKPLQVVYRKVDLKVARASWSGLDEAVQRDRLARWLEEDRERGFELSEAPLMRLALLELGPEVHQLVWTQHHLVVDGWSQAQLLRELFGAYAELARGLEPRVEPARSFREYISWLQQQDPGQAESFWRESLAGFTSPTLVAEADGKPADPATPSFRAARRETLALSAETTAALRETARQSRLTLNTLVQGAWALLLAQRSGRGDVVFGATVAGRPPELPGVESIVGPFINTLPVRVEVRPEATLREWLAGLQGRLAELRRYEHSALVDIQKWSALPGGVPLFDHILVFENVALPQELSQQLPGLAIEEEAAATLTNYPLNVIVIPGTELALSILYDADRFGTVEVARILERLAHMLTVVSEDQDLDREVGALPLLPPAERHQALIEWNDTRSTFPREACLPELFAEVARERPDAPALVGAAGEEWSYRRLDEESSRLARRLRDLGVGPETAVGIAMERSPELILGTLAILKAGGTYVPLGAEYPDERLAFMLADTGAEIVLVHAATRDRMVGMAGLARIVAIEEDGWQQEEPGWPGVRVPAESLAYVIYTSGSTGRPKGVAVPHRAIVRLVRETNYVRLGPGDRTGHVANISFDAATYEIWGALLTGAAAVVIPRDVVLSPADFARWIEERRVTSMFLTSALFTRMSREAPGAFAAMSELLVGGEAVDPVAARSVLAGRPPRRLLNGYGPTESTTFAAWHPIREVPEGTASLPIGLPLANTTLYVLDRSSAAVPPGSAGELCIGGDGLARGYLNRPELTAERFFPHPWAEGERLYRTGDLVRQRPDGAIEFLGRLDDQVKIRGFRIEPGEIEAALAGHPEVRECAVLARRDSAGDALLVAYVVGPRTPETLRTWLAERLPDYMLPSAFLVLEALPLTPNGKLDRRALPAPGQVRTPAAGHTAPSDPVEELVAGIWTEVLGVDHIGVHDDFFALGGHSLLATQVVSRIRGVLGVDLPLRTLFEAPTVAALARVVREDRQDLAAPPIVPVPRPGNPIESDLPLSFAQQRLWLLDQLAPGNPAYNIPLAVRLTGEITAAELARVFTEVTRRHEALRTTFAARDGKPAQVIDPELRLDVPVTDLSHLPEAEREARAREVALEEARKPFDLERGPLLRLALVRLGEAEHLLLINLHHIVSDGWSMGVLLREVAALCAGDAALPPLPVQYADFACWQRSWMQGEVLEAQLGYWKRQLAGAPRVLELPTDRPRPAVPTSNGALRPVALSPALAEAVQLLCRQQGTTPFMALLAAWAVLLGRQAGQDDVLVGSPIAGRNRKEIEGLIGFFVNTLVLRVRLAEAPSFRDLLSQVRQTTLDAYACQDLPFERLVEELAPDRGAHRSPLVQALFVLQNAPLPAFRLPGLDLSVLPPEPGAPKFDLALTLQGLQEMDGRLTGVLEYDADLFDPTTVDRLLARFAILLAGAVEDPDQEIETLPLLLDGERQQILVEATAPRLEPPAATTIAALLAATLAALPDAERAPAVIFAGEPPETLSYAELDRRSALWARELRGLGVGPERRVGLFVRRSPRMVVGILAVLRAGGAYVPLDPAWPEERLSWMLDDAGVDLVLTEEGTADRLPRETDRPLRRVFLDHPLPAGRETEAGPEAAAEPGNAAYIIYTSGSTGRPKGVVATQDGLAAFSQAMAGVMDLTPDDRVLQFASLSFDASAVALYPPLIRGAAIVLHPEPASLTPWELVALCAAQGVTVVELPAALWRLTAREAEAAGLRFGPAVRLFMTGGESLAPEALRPWGRTVDPRARLVSSYGPTEATVVAAVYQVSGAEAIEPSSTGASLGRALHGTGIYVLDTRLMPVPLDAPGEIFLGGSGVTRGYLGRPDLTAATFLPDPWGPPGSRLYRTGDRARWRTHGLEFLGRVDQQLKIRGFRIEPGEIEAVLATHPSVHEALVLARRLGPDDLRLVAYATRREGASAAEAELRSWLQERLPEHLVPASIVLLDAFPLAPTGKVDRKALPDPQGTVDETAHAEPSGPLEELLTGLWRELLQLDRLGVHDNFFTLGGHSLLATQLVSRIRGALGVDLPLRTLFEAPTVASLAWVVQTSRRGGLVAPPIVPVSRPRHQIESDLPLSFAQQRLWLLDQLEPGSPAYNIPLAVRLTGETSAAELARIFTEVGRRHEALRTTFAAREGKPVQVIAPELRLDVPVTDLSHLPEAEREARARALALEEARRPFDLERGPLLRLALARLGERDHLLVINMHHIVSDGWSMGVLLREVAVLSDPGAAALPELPVQYADFAHWQRNWLQGEVLEARLGYWRQQLAGAPRALELPTDRPRPAVQTSNGALVPVALSPSLTAAVQSLCRQQRVTPFMALLAAWSLLLGRHAGQDDVLVGSPVAGRNRREIEGLIGFFVNTVVFRTDLGGAPAFGELLERVRQVALDGYAHQDVPFERIVEEVVPERDLAVSPLFQVFFALQNAPVGKLEVPGLSLTPLPLDGGIAKFDLSLSLGEGPSGLSGALEHNTNLFDGSTVARLWDRFVALLEAAAGDPAVSVTDLPLLLPAEREQLAAWNDTGAAPPSGPSLHELFAEQAERTPGAVALVHGSDRQTYAELAERAGDLARHLRTLGVGPEVRVAVCLERSPDLIVSLLGVLAAGGAYVPIDPAYPAERRAFMLEDSGAAVLVSRGGLAGELPAGRLGMLDLEGFKDFRDTKDFKDTRERLSSLEPLPSLGGGSLAYLIYTSGSTGRPKGVAIEHRSAVSLVAWAREEFSAEELSGVLASTSVCFDLSVFEIFVPLLSGGTVHLVDNALALAASGTEAGVGVRLLNTVPSVAAELLRLGALPPSVRTVCLAGEPLPAALAARLYATGTVRRVLNLYGPSEDTTYSTGALAPRDDPRAPAIGRAVRGTRAHVVDRRGALVPPGVAGELWLAGAGLARGYLGRPELTAERFTPDPFATGAGERVYRTGDLVRWRSDGELEFLGRIDHQVKLRGFRIELGEIETVLGSHPAIREAVVQVWEEAGDRRLAAWVTLDQADHPTDPTGRTDPSEAMSALAAWLREKLPEHMVPSAFVVLDSLPLTPNGKVDRRALPAPDRARRHRRGGMVAPRTRTEEAVAEIWKELLGLEQVSVEDGFFELGGHSLLATQVLARVRKTFGVDLPLRDIFKRPTIAGLSELIDAQAAVPADEDELAALLAELDHLSDEEARERLEEIRALESEV